MYSLSIPLLSPPAPQTYSSQKSEEPDLGEIIRRARQSKLDDAAARRLELRRVREQQEIVRGDKSRLNSLASIEKGRELFSKSRHGPYHSA